MSSKYNSHQFQGYEVITFTSYKQLHYYEYLPNYVSEIAKIYSSVHIEATEVGHFKNPKTLTHFGMKMLRWEVRVTFSIKRTIIPLIMSN